MTDAEKPKRKSWLRKLGVVVIVLLVLLVAFHRPILFHGSRVLLTRLAADQNLALHYEIGGSIFTNLWIQNFSVTATGPAPVESLTLDRAELRYHLIHLLTKGLSGFLQVVKVDGLRVVLSPQPSAGPAAPSSGGGIPWIVPEVLELKNIDVSLKSPDADIPLVSGLTFTLYPDKPGILKAEVLNIPDFHRFESLSATTSYADRVLHLRGLVLDPRLSVESLTTDFSEIDSNRLNFDIRADFLGAALQANAALSQLDSSPDISASAEMDTLELTAVQEFLNSSLPVQGTIEKLTLAFQGNLQRPQAWSGNVALKGKNLVYQGSPSADLTIDGKIAEGRASIDISAPFEDESRLEAQVVATLPKKDAGWTQTEADAKFDIRVSDLARFPVPKPISGPLTASGTMALRGENLEASTDLEFSGQNRLSFSGSAKLPPGGGDWMAQPAKAWVSVDFGDLSAVSDGSLELAGALHLSGNVESQSRIVDGTFALSGADIKVSGLPIDKVGADISLDSNVVNVSQFEIVFDQKNQIEGRASVELEPLSYEGTAKVALKDLSIFQSMTGDQEIGGSLFASWTGSGSADLSQQRGTLDLSIEDARWGELTKVSAEARADYTGDYINVPYLTLRLNDLASASAPLFWSENRLKIGPIHLDQNGTRVLEASGEIPLHLWQGGNLASLIPMAEPVAFSAWAKNVDLSRLLRPFLKPSPIQGTISLSAEASGSLSALDAKLGLAVRGLRSDAAKKLAPANADLDIRLADNQLTLDSTLRQALIQPLRINGQVPLDIPALIRDRKIDPSTPLDLRVRLPSTSLAFLTTMVPDLRQVRGTAEADVRASGTIESPEITGTLRSDLDALRFRDPILPPVNSVRIRLDFAKNRMAITNFSGLLAGGTFHLRGGIGLASLAKPDLQISIAMRNALALQNDDVSIRLSSNLFIRGPMDAATVTGTVGVTRSRFFRTIEILPIGLPGRPAPQPPLQDLVIGVSQPPLRNWKFDVAIRTIDPFLLQSNLARGRIVLDLKLGGTGFKPWLDGNVLIEQLTSSLPFSRLNIDSGRVYFTPQQPFVPQLALEATSSIRGYEVRVFIDGSAYSPTAVFTSQPPLPQAEIVSLLATGMTTDQLGRDPNALAGQAAMLALRQLYQRVFRSNKPPPEKESFLERIRLDIGVTDPKTGRQATSIGIPLSERIMLTGGMDVGGNFQGQVKYLIRFR